MFSKPEMKESLLLRPPFRFIRDIISKTIHATGFGEGLYNETKLKSMEVFSKSEKLEFLKKMINLVSMALNENIDIKPMKVLRGLEPEKTNIFLEEFYKAAISEIDTGSLVENI